MLYIQLFTVWSVLEKYLSEVSKIAQDGRPRVVDVTKGKYLSERTDKKR